MESTRGKDMDQSAVLDSLNAVGKFNFQFKQTLIALLNDVEDGVEGTELLANNKNIKEAHRQLKEITKKDKSSYLALRNAINAAIALARKDNKKVYFSSAVDNDFVRRLLNLLGLFSVEKYISRTDDESNYTSDLVQKLIKGMDTEKQNLQAIEKLNTTLKEKDQNYAREKEHLNEEKDRLNMTLQEKERNYEREKEELNKTIGNLREHLVHQPPTVFNSSFSLDGTNGDEQSFAYLVNHNETGQEVDAHLKDKDKLKRCLSPARYHAVVELISYYRYLKQCGDSELAGSSLKELIYTLNRNSILENKNTTEILQEEVKKLTDEKKNELLTRIIKIINDIQKLEDHPKESVQKRRGMLFQLYDLQRNPDKGMRFIPVSKKDVNRAQFFRQEYKEHSTKSSKGKENIRPTRTHTKLK